ncbi:MAG: DNA internalization-related competence protein ComEC/Rec2 [Pseudomonadota bacterium]
MPYTQRYLLGFCGGALLLGLPWPGGSWLPLRLAGVAGAVAVLLGAGLVCRRRARRRGRDGGRGWPVVLGLLCGACWSGWMHHDALSARLPAALEGGDVEFEARVIGDPVALTVAPGQPSARRFQVRVAGGMGGPAPGTVLRLSWYGAEPVRRGDVWRFRAVLRRPWSYANPGGFDYERWLLGSGIQGTGYIREGRLEARGTGAAIDRVRTALEAGLEASGAQRREILRALLLGRSSAIDEQRWAAFRATGTVHLMVISGLHVSLAAALGLGLGRWLGALCPGLLLWMPARALGAVCGAGVAAGYVAVAGAGLPALRALIMSGCVLVLLAGGRSGRAGSALLLALAGVLALDPLAVHQQGFWLSFAAVGILLLALGHRHDPRSRLGPLVRAQLALSLGMLPLVALTTGTVPWTGIPANLLAVPVMSLWVVPLTLLGGALVVLLPDLSAHAFAAADLALGGVLTWLDWLARAPALLVPATAWSLLVAQAAALWWLLAPPRRHVAVLGLCAALPLLPRPPALASGEFRVTALDVGQGTAVLVDTRHHRLLFDTGPAYPSGFETGSAVVAPSLLATGPARLDVLILSHEDVDHVGGADYLLGRVKVETLFASGPRDGARACGGHGWRWDGVGFRLLDIPRPAEASDNERSCVLLVDDGDQRMLLAGDLEARVEASLLRVLAAGGHGLRPGAELVFAPHHGSATSSSPAFVRLLAPRLVFVSAGRGNQFGHPHPQVVARYRRQGAAVLQTGVEGALIWHSSAPDRVVRWRRDRGPYWRSQPRELSD